LQLVRKLLTLIHDARTHEHKKNTQRLSAYGTDIVVTQ